MVGHKAFASLEEQLATATWQHKATQDVPKYSVRLMCQELRSFIRQNGTVIALHPAANPLLNTIVRLTEHIDRLLDEGNKVAQEAEGVLLFGGPPYTSDIQAEHRRDLAEAVHEWRRGERE